MRPLGGSFGVVTLVVCAVTVRYWLSSSSMETGIALPVYQTDGGLTS